MPAAQDREGTLSAEEVRVLGLLWSAALVERSRRSGTGMVSEEHISFAIEIG
jgi:hypothetical protein